MPGATLPLAVVPLASRTAPFAILGRFPPGFVREAAGGYRVAEEFVVLAGDLCYDDLDLTPGALVHVGPNRVRQSLSSITGCLVLVWFEGQPLFRREAELLPTPGRVLETYDLSTMIAPIRTPLSTWTMGAVSDWPSGAEGFDCEFWAASQDDWPGGQHDTPVWRERIAFTSGGGTE